MKVATAGLILIAMTVAAEARVTRIEITKREPFVAGQSFGATGAYQKAAARFNATFDPRHRFKPPIVDLAKAPRNPSDSTENSPASTVRSPAHLLNGTGA